MGISGVSSSRQSLHTRAIGRAVQLALEDVKKVQGRMTEELRGEDAIRNIALRGSEVHVTVDTRHEFKRDGLRDLVKELLKKHGADGVRVEIHASKADPKAAVEKANAALEQIHGRTTKDLRSEDDIVNFALRDDGRIAVVFKAHPRFSSDEILASAKNLLSAAGLKSPKLDVVRPAINPFGPGFPRVQVPAGGLAPAPSANTMAGKVDDFAADIAKVQRRMTEGLRIEDSVANVKLVGAKVELKVFKQSAETFGGLDKVTAWAKQELKERGISLPLVVKIKDPRDV